MEHFCLQMVYEMTKILTETEPEKSHLHGNIGQLILIDRGLNIHTQLLQGCSFIVDAGSSGKNDH